MLHSILLADFILVTFNLDLIFFLPVLTVFLGTTAVTELTGKAGLTAGQVGVSWRGCGQKRDNINIRDDI